MLTTPETKVAWPKTPCTQLFKVNRRYVFILLCQKFVQDDAHLVTHIPLKEMSSFIILIIQQNENLVNVKYVHWEVHSHQCTQLICT